LAELATLVDLLEQRAAAPRGSYTFVKDGTNIGLLDFPHLAQRAKAIAAQLQMQNAPGNTVLLLYPPGLDFLIAFFACLYAGMIAVPLPSPERGRSKRALPRLRAIANDAAASLILAPAELADELDHPVADLRQQWRWLATDTVDLSLARQWRMPAGGLSDIAYLQYTSGSTTSPRGVMLTHANVLDNLECFGCGMGYDAASVEVTWMPHFHDYGLVGGLIHPLYRNIPAYILSPLAFIKQPFQWLKTITEHRATHSHGPNFAYELCIQRVSEAQKDRLDLTGWRTAGNGAEPVRADTLRRFAEAFARCGFNADSFYPAYGLAEATLFVSARCRSAPYRTVRVRTEALVQHRVARVAEGAAAEESRLLVSCGVPDRSADLRIVDPDTKTECPPGCVGEIWFAGSSVALGYWRRTAETRATFGARLDDDQTAGPFLRSGDLGFCDRGELYVTGRLKDVIVVAGANHYPQDIEWSILSDCPELRRDHCVAVGSGGDHAEQVVIMAEPDRPQPDWSELMRRIQAIVAREHGLSVAAVAILPRGGIFKTSSGKLQRGACREAFYSKRLAPLAMWVADQARDFSSPSPQTSDLQEWICAELARAVRCDPARIDPDVPFVEQGLDSRAAVALAGALEERLDRHDLSETLLWEYPTLALLVAHLTGSDAVRAAPAATEGVGVTTLAVEPIAVIGTACRFPGADDLEEFWGLLRGGRTAVTACARLPGVGGGFLKSIDGFDAAFFGLSAAEAEAMDPQQRLLLEVAWEALEHAGIDPGALRGSSAGVFVGISAADYGLQQLRRPDAAAAITAHTGTGLAFSIAANRLSYLLDLRGPSLAIDTACSSSLVAVHQACRSLQHGDCTIALAGGVNLILSPHLHLAIERAGMLSPEHRCKTFDAEADGYVRGEGCGIVVLKRRADALRDGDAIFCLIRSTAVNQDGRSNGLTAPNPIAQQELIARALAAAGLAAADIGYVEAHGTGTPLGDPIEVGALREALGGGRTAQQPCWIGSVKANIGHLEAAAGIAGLIKALLVLRGAEIVPQINLRNLNPLLRIEGTPFRIATAGETWPSAAAAPRRAAVSSFGFGGTNAHAILEEVPPAAYRATAARPPHLLTLSAATPAALDALEARYSAWLGQYAEVPPADLCFTAATGRAALPERLAIVAPDAPALRAALETRGTGVYRGRAPAGRPRIGFLFSGQGSQYIGMGRSLYESEPEFRAALDECDAVLRDELPSPLLAVVWGESSYSLDQTAYTQPALFAVEYALVRLWRSWGIEPVAVLGHSIGEYAAACVAGILKPADALRLVAARGRLMQALPLDGGMLAVAAAESVLTEMLAADRIAPDEVSLAAVNAPQSCVLSGNRSALDALHSRLQAAGLRTRFLPVSHAFHSARMDPILDEFHRIASTISYRQPRLALIGNLEGQPLAAAPGAEYWTRHLRNTVRFADGVSTLGGLCDAIVEIGPGPGLSALAAQCLADRDVTCIPSLDPRRDARRAILDALAQLHVAGATPDWHGFYHGKGCRRIAALPSYPFEHRRFALPSVPANIHASPPADLTRWGYMPHWVPIDAEREERGDDWLIFGDRRGIGDALRQTIQERNEHYATSIEGLRDGAAPVRAVYLEAADWPGASLLDQETLPRAMASRFARIAAVLRDLAAQSRRSVRLLLVTCGAVAGPVGTPEQGLLQSLVWGLGRALREEFPDWQVRLLDLDPAAEPRSAAEQLLGECTAREAWPEVCWRAGRRYALRLRERPLASASAPPITGTWLVTGGLGRLGRTIAAWLARSGADRIVLVGRRPADPAAGPFQQTPTGGAIIETRALDVTDFSALRDLVSELASGTPALLGVIHAAGVIDDGVLHQQSAERLHAVLAPKVLGGWYLHLATRRLPLRHFILFSSAAGLFGNPGQSAYAAANTFLDALAWYRHAQDLPALSIDWSAWSEAAAEPRVSESLARKGFAPIAAEQGVEAFARALAVDVPQLAVLAVRDGRVPDLPGLASAQPAAGKSGAFLDTLRSRRGPERAAAIEARILDFAAMIRGCERAALRSDLGFFQQGLDSLATVELRNRLQHDLSRPLPITLPFDFPTPAALAAELIRRFGLAETTDATSARKSTFRTGTDRIAIIGLGCRMPGRVDGPDAFWGLLRDGRDAITEVPSDRWDIDRFYHPDPAHPGTIVTRHGGFVEAVHAFDAAFFGIAPREMRHLDPQQRLLLEVCWETFEHAGVPASSLAGSQTGVFIGISTNDYVYGLAREPERIDGYLGTGNALSVAANRLSYVFGLEGPSLAIDTACSSSLVAVHQACMSLREGECDIAIAGGVNLMLDPAISINHSRAQMLAPDGRCKAFSAAADGYVRSEGCGLVLLKRLADAERDGDRLLAIIRGSAVNQDGRSAGLTVPNGRAQQRVIRRALQQAGLVPAEISYVEAHGTGTPLGDPIEIGALTEVFGAERRELAVGSVKTNIGHLEAAAGVAGLLKVALALKHGALPAHLHCAAASPRIDWAESPVRISGATVPWTTGAVPRRAGVSSFGFGGTNAHVVVEEAPALPARASQPLPSYLLPLSARTPTALRSLADSMAAFLTTTDEDVADICFTAAFGRDHFRHRLAVSGDDAAALSTGLRAWLGGEVRVEVRVEVQHGSIRDGEPPPFLADVEGAGSEQLAAAYVRGMQPNWRARYVAIGARRVAIPGHPFERQQYYPGDRPAAASAVADLYRLRWRPVSPAAPAAGRAGDRWLVLADRGGWGEAIGRCLEADGAECRLVYRGATDRGRVAGLDDAAAITGLLAESAPPQAILHLWACDSPAASTLRPETISEVLRHEVASIPPLLRTARQMPAPPRLWVATQTAQSTGPEDRLEGLAQAPLWGLGRSLALEVPELWGGMIDLPVGAPTRDQAATLVAVLYGALEDRQVALRRGVVLAPRLEPFGPARAAPVPIRPDASYLITGGFGSVGRVLGHWLARQGACHLWLVGRTGPADAAARQYVAALRAQRVVVETACLDIADAEGLARQLAVWDRIGPPLRGIIHAAGVNGETPAETLDWPGIAALLPGKVQGGLALAQQTAGFDLDFFVSLSSIAALWGAQHQAGYALANAFLDGLAGWQRTRGVAAAAVNFGPIEGSAMLDATAARHLSRLGLRPMPLSRAAAAVGSVLGTDCAQVAVTEADWPRFAELYRARSQTGLFETVAGRGAPRPLLSNGHDATASSVDLRARLAGELGATLQLPGQAIDPAVPLLRLGLDSLGALDLRNRLRHALGIELPISDLLGEFSLDELVTRIGAPSSPETTGEAGWVTGEL
jgi:acyl transferase domain-containing protein/acyl-CoA synthetase (AMP-forming)/AMP-acid ligase II/acyl carrier protein